MVPLCVLQVALFHLFIGNETHCTVLLYNEIMWSNLWNNRRDVLTVSDLPRAFDTVLVFA